MRLVRGALQGLAAGTVATVCEAVWSRCEPALLGGRRPVFDTTLMAQRFIGANTGRAPSEPLARRAGTLMRAGYGPAWGVLYGGMSARRRSPALGATLRLAATIWLAELALLPRARATPPLAQWPATDVALDGSNTLVFAAAATIAVRLARRDGRSARAAHP